MRSFRTLWIKRIVHVENDVWKVFVPFVKGESPPTLP